MFLQVTTNMEEIFSLLTEKVKDFQFPENKEVNITSGYFLEQWGLRYAKK